MSQAACGLPDTFSGRAYPVLAGAVDWSGHRASAVRRVSGANLEVERFVEKAKMAFSENKPTGTPEQLEKLVRCGDWGEFHSPLAPDTP